MTTRSIRMNRGINLTLATTLSILITFMLFHFLNNKRATGSLFQQIIGDSFHLRYLDQSCFINQQNSTRYRISRDEHHQIARKIRIGFPCIMITLFYCCGLKIVLYIFSIILTVGNVWLLARLCDDIQLSYQVDVFTVYFLVWQFSYPISQWCSHELSWPALIFHQGSMCLLPAIVVFIDRDTMFRMPPLMELAVFWTIAFHDVYVCLHPHGRNRIEVEKMCPVISNFKFSTFPRFCYYSHDIEDGIDDIDDGIDDIEDRIDEIEEFYMLGGGDFVTYNWLLLWLLTPSMSLKIQLYVLCGFIVCIQIALHLSFWIQRRLDLIAMPGVPIPVIIISTYAIIIDYLTQISDVDCVKIIE